ncbi:hypothetical protein A9974_06385 [Achromobacter sp. UMC71]|nr:hypothetical protein [Achromobacter sp. UMC71]
MSIATAENAVASSPAFDEQVRIVQHHLRAVLKHNSISELTDGFHHTTERGQTVAAPLDAQGDRGRCQSDVLQNHPTVVDAEVILHKDTVAGGGVAIPTLQNVHPGQLGASAVYDNQA